MATGLVLAIALLAGPAAASYCEEPEDPAMGPDEAECAHQAKKDKGVDEQKFAGWPWGANWALGGLAVAGLAGAGFSLRSLWLPSFRALFAPLFARLTRRDVTDHPLRARILSAAARQPGITAADLARDEGINLGTLDYHVSVLVRDGQLRAVKAGRNRLLFMPGAGVDVERVAEVSVQGRGEVARAILQEPGVHASAIADRLGLSRATVHHHLAKLEAAGLIRVERGLRACCFPTDRLPAALEPVRRRRIAVFADPTRPTGRPTE